MIVKSKARRTNSFKQLVGYLFSDKGRTKTGFDFILTRNIKGENPEEWVSQLEANEQFRIRTGINSTKVLHEIISFHKNDTQNLTTEKLRLITEEYLDMRSPNGMFIAIPHLNDDHLHIHICGSPLEYLTGKNLRMSRREFQTIKQRIQEFQFSKFPELSHSIVKHTNGSMENKGIQKMDKSHESIKLELGSLLNSFKGNLNQLRDYLKPHNVEIYFRGGKEAGVVFQGKKYRFKRLGIALPMEGDKLSNQLNRSRSN
jgi:hypothetical protein